MLLIHLENVDQSKKYPYRRREIEKLDVLFDEFVFLPSLSKMLFGDKQEEKLQHQ